MAKSKKTAFEVLFDSMETNDTMTVSLGGKTLPTIQKQKDGTGRVVKEKEWAEKEQKDT